MRCHGIFLTFVTPPYDRKYDQLLNMEQSSGIYSLKMKLRVYRVKLQDLSPMIIFSRESGSITNMLKNLYLPVLQQRRKELRLTFSFKIVEDGVPAIRKNNYFEKSREKRNIKPKQYKDYETKI